MSAQKPAVFPSLSVPTYSVLQAWGRAISVGLPITNSARSSSSRQNTRRGPSFQKSLNFLQATELFPGIFGNLGYAEIASRQDGLTNFGGLTGILLSSNKISINWRILMERIANSSSMGFLSILPQEKATRKMSQLVSEPQNAYFSTCTPLTAGRDDHSTLIYGVRAQDA